MSYAIIVSYYCIKAVALLLILLNKHVLVSKIFFFVYVLLKFNNKRESRELRLS